MNDDPVDDGDLGVVIVDERGDCRVCGEAAWSADEEGHVHLCCKREGDPCAACVASRALARQRAGGSR